MKVSQEILALLRVVSDGKNFYVRIQGYEDDKRFPNGIALSTNFPTVDEAEQFRLDVAKYIGFLRKHPNFHKPEGSDEPFYWDEYFVDAVNQCKWLTDEMLADKQIYELLGTAMLNIRDKFQDIDKIYPPNEYYQLIVKDNAAAMAAMLKEYCKLFVNSPNRHAPQFHVSLRSGSTNFYECKICGYRYWHLTKHEAGQAHSVFTKEHIAVKEKLRILFK